MGKVLGAMIGLGVALLVTHVAWVVVLLAAVGFVVGLRVDLQHAEVIERGRMGDGDPVDVPPRRSAPARPAEPDTLELLVDLLVAVSCVDGDVSREEIRSIRRLLDSEPWRRRVPTEQLADRLKQAIARPVPVGAAARLAKGVIPHAERVGFLDALYALARADGALERPERIALDRVAKIFEISETEAQEVAAAHTAPPPPPSPPRPPPDENAVSYQILGLAVDASDSDLKKAYRKLAREHHPDRVAHLGKAAVEAASARFREIDQAYENIRKARGL